MSRYTHPYMLSLFLGILGLFAGNCGVNSGNPIGNARTARTSTSLYMETASVSSLKSLTLRVRGIQLVKSTQMDKPDEASTETILFDSAKIIDPTDVSQGEKIALLENKTIVYRDFHQVRLLLDPAQNGTAQLTSGETKTLMAMPLDLFVSEQGLAKTEGGRQSDQLAMTSTQSLMREGVENKITITMDWSLLMVEPKSLSTGMSEYFTKERGLQQMDSMMFLQPMQKDKESLKTTLR